MGSGRERLGWAVEDVEVWTFLGGSGLVSEEYGEARGASKPRWRRAMGGLGGHEADVTARREVRVLLGSFGDGCTKRTLCL